MFKKNLFTVVTMVLLAALVLAGCGKSNEGASSNNNETKKEEVNLYTSRHYEVDDKIFADFTKETGIKVNLIKGKEDELIERLTREGKATKGDLFFTSDAGRLHWAKDKDLLQSVESETLNKNIPDNLSDKDNQWFGLTKRARVIVYDQKKVDKSELSTYEALTEDKWKGKVLIRSSENIYNQSLVSSFISLNGKDEAKKWAEGIVNNMARDPQGGDKDQAKGIAAGEGDVAIMNSYYFGQMLNSEDPEEVKVAKQLSVFFPNQETTGTHINISGIGVTKHAKNKENAIELMEYLSSPKVQEVFAEANYEYPVNKEVEPSELLKSWGPFKEQDLNLSELGENNADAVKIMNEVSWK
ncbi:Fe(3+) ABC transporter substrate-binding protein [Fictibacillus sp. 5RED26]|uniref:Fe(3+) ABC transporter substrate-binding protein n=1 Tax=Fictibacillus sp. 5RED26 TaxID=2745876 RepID=UPI0018CE59BE|nr:Fe(3+) ABC transporter substrate-binding protein [Fictibacillus sp. 5RED26]MBH0157944.1 Fe(3+) ABC transporter substrate-binding protein [Fictibacillus sp. 5RED26]